VQIGVAGGVDETAQFGGRVGDVFGDSSRAPEQERSGAGQKDRADGGQQIGANQAR
jgi:hypothetical protein